MAVIQDLENEFAARALDRHGLKLLRPADALEYVSRCAEHGIDVLGIDGFRLNGDTIQPLLEHSIDLSLSSAPRKQAEVADFLRARLNTDLWFEVVVET